VRRPRRATDLKRRKPLRAPFDRILIVCEGSKTEPNYFNEMTQQLRLSTNVLITGDCGSDPRSVVRAAIDQFNSDRSLDYVYCVFDRDAHVGYDEALVQVHDKRLRRVISGKSAGNAKFSAVPSVPCFEYWVLLHFEFTTAHMARFSDVLPRLKVHSPLSSYDKGQGGLYAILESKQTTALEHAKRADHAAASVGTDNPTTKLPMLVEHLLRLSKQMNKPKS